MSDTDRVNEVARIAMYFEGSYNFISLFHAWRKRCSYCQKIETSHCCIRCKLHLPSTRGIFKSNCFVFEVSEARSHALREGRKVVFKHISVRQSLTWKMHAWLFATFW